MWNESWLIWLRKVPIPTIWQRHRKFLISNLFRLALLLPQNLFLYVIASCKILSLFCVNTYKNNFWGSTKQDDIDRTSKISRHCGKSEKQQSHKSDIRFKMSHRSSRNQKSVSTNSSRYTAAPSKTSIGKMKILRLLKKQQKELERQAKISKWTQEKTD